MVLTKVSVSKAFESLSLIHIRMDLHAQELFEDDFGMTAKKAI